MSERQEGSQTTAFPEPRESGNPEKLKGTAPQSGGRKGRWWIMFLILALVGVSAAWYATSGGEEETDDTVVAAPSLAEVVLTDLAETSEYEGTIGRLEGDPVILRLQGTITALPEAGTTLEQGDVAAWVDNQPVVLLQGETPVWREMREDSEGPDVLQLETALSALGYNENATMTVDETYSSATESVVEAWQEAVGAEDDGVVGLGEVIFLEGPVRIDSLLVEVGDQVSAGTAILSTSSENIEVGFDLPTFEQGNVEVRDPVVITLPDLSTADGVVTAIATVATVPGDGGETTFAVTVALDDPSLADGIDGAPVTVGVITDKVEQVMAVPVEALLALAEGGYAVEVSEGNSTRLVAVDPGFFAEGLVEISGEISAGDQVVVP
jgi:membrane fusion protein, multidrug efflux system